MIFITLLGVWTGNFILFNSAHVMNCIWSKATIGLIGALVKCQP